MLKITVLCGDTEVISIYEPPAVHRHNMIRWKDQVSRIVKLVCTHLYFENIKDVYIIKKLYGVSGNLKYLHIMKRTWNLLAMILLLIFRY